MRNRLEQATWASQHLVIEQEELAGICWACCAR